MNKQKESVCYVQKTLIQQEKEIQNAQNVQLEREVQLDQQSVQIVHWDIILHQKEVDALNVILVQLLLKLGQLNAFHVHRDMGQMQMEQNVQFVQKDIDHQKKEVDA